MSNHSKSNKKAAKAETAPVEHTSEKADAAKKNEIITLTDEDGNDLEFEFLDLIDYSSKQYAVLVPAEEEADQVVIFEVEDASTEDNTFTPVNDPDLAMAIFNLFKDRNKEFYDFS